VRANTKRILYEISATIEAGIRYKAFVIVQKQMEQQCLFNVLGRQNSIDKFKSIYKVSMFL